MEVHPILGRGDSPNPGLWYVISSYGQYPSMRVGHTMTFVPGRDGTADKLVIIGGANPSGPFAETHILYLDKYEWDELECGSLTGRYEHYAFNPQSQPDNIYIFGGADQASNLNDMQMLNLVTEEWTSVSVSGTPPSPRTCHGSAFIGDKLYVFGGGGEKSEPVTDRKLHVFDVDSLTWSQPEVNGKVPKPRLGHALVAIGNKVYLHGGMARDIFYSELYELNLETMTWKLLRCKGDVPQGCTAHAAVAISNTQFCIQGGMTPNGALDSTYVFDTVSCRWKKMSFASPPPACRLDHAICLGYITSYSKSNIPNEETMLADKKAEVPVQEDSGQCESRTNSTSDHSESVTDTESKEAASHVKRQNRTSDPSESVTDTESKDTASHVKRQNRTSDPSESVTDTESKEKGVTNETQVNKSGEKGHVQEAICASKSTENIEVGDLDAEKGTQESADETAADFASKLKIEGSKQSPPLEAAASDNTDVNALTSLLSIEGAKQVIPGNSSGGESGKACGECMQRCLVCVIHGGMDTGGEIFDDCLVWRVDGAPL